MVGGFSANRDLHTGQLLWRVERDRPGGDAWAVIGANDLYVIFLNQIRSYTIMTGELNWSVETPFWSVQNALLNNNLLYLENTFSDGVGAFDVQTQKLIWQQEGSFTRNGACVFTEQTDRNNTEFGTSARIVGQHSFINYPTGRQWMLPGFSTTYGGPTWSMYPWANSSNQAKIIATSWLQSI